MLRDQHIGVVAVSMIGLVGALMASRKPRPNAFPQQTVVDNNIA